MTTTFPSSPAEAGIEEERARLLALMKKRAAHEAAAAAHHSGKWHSAYEWHLTRHAAMCDLIDVAFGYRHTEIAQKDQKSVDKNP